MARAIIRWSVNSETSNRTGNEVRKALENAGFRKVGTAAFEADGLTRIAALRAMGDALEILRVCPGGGTLDHVWVYVDSTKPKKVKRP